MAEPLPRPLSARAAHRLELLEVLTLGAPFCGFKLVAGLVLASRAGSLRMLGFALVALGALDALINLANLAGLLWKRARPLPACTFSLVFSLRARPGTALRAKWIDLGNSLDVLLSFSLVALMIGCGELRGLPAPRALALNVCVILNVLGAGAARFGASLRDLREP